ncbi:hypothetical protein D3C72_2205680 [compost metagenome]
MNVFDFFFRNREVVLIQDHKVCKFSFFDIAFEFFFAREPRGTFGPNVESFFTRQAIGVAHMF